MYERSYDTDWSPDEVDTDEATDRLFALGVADVLGEAPEGERERLLDLAETAYERSVFDLSFEEGQQKAREIRRAPDRDADDESVWDDLVAGEPARSAADAVRESEVPDALAPAELLDRFDDEPSLLDPPEALRRD